MQFLAEKVVGKNDQHIRVYESGALAEGAKITINRISCTTQPCKENSYSSPTFGSSCNMIVYHEDYNEDYKGKQLHTLPTKQYQQ